MFSLIYNIIFWGFFVKLLMALGFSLSRFIADASLPFNYLLHQAPICRYKREFVTDWVTKDTEPAVMDNSNMPIRLHRHKGGRLVIYSHGNSDDLLTVDDMCAKLSKRLKATVMSYDPPGYGLNNVDCTWGRTHHGFNAALSSCYDYAIRHGFSDENIYLMGSGIGTGPVCEVAAKRKVAGVILVSPFKSIRALVAGWNEWASEQVSARWNNLDTISKIHKRILMIHGRDDLIIPSDHTKALGVKAEQGTEVILSGLGHHDIPTKTLGNIIYKWMTNPGAKFDQGNPVSSYSTATNFLKQGAQFVEGVKTLHRQVHG